MRLEIPVTIPLTPTSKSTFGREREEGAWGIVKGKLRDTSADGKMGRLEAECAKMGLKLTHVLPNGDSRAILYVEAGAVEQTTKQVAETTQSKLAALLSKGVRDKASFIEALGELLKVIGNSGLQRTSENIKVTTSSSDSSATLPTDGKEAPQGSKEDPAKEVVSSAPAA